MFIVHCQQRTCELAFNYVHINNIVFSVPDNQLESDDGIGNRQLNLRNIFSCAQQENSEE